jgi:hypothetical protein
LITPLPITRNAPACKQCTELPRDHAVERARASAGVFVFFGAGGRVLDGVFQSAPHEVSHMAVGERIEDVLACPPARDDAHGAEEAKLLRHRGQPRPRSLRELGDAPFAFRQALEELEAGGIRDDAEESRRALEGIVARRRAPGASLRVLVGIARRVAWNAGGYAMHHHPAS